MLGPHHARASASSDGFQSMTAQPIAPYRMKLLSDVDAIVQLGGTVPNMQHDPAVKITKDILVDLNVRNVGGRRLRSHSPSGIPRLLTT